MAKIRNTTDQRRRYVRSSANGQVEVGGLQYELKPGDFQMIADALEILSPDTRKAVSRAHYLCSMFRTLSEHDGSTPEGSKPAKTKPVLIDVIGGVAHVVSAPFGVKVEIHDYDCDAIDDASDIKRDKSGDRYIVSTFPA